MIQFDTTDDGGSADNNSSSWGQTLMQYKDSAGNYRNFLTVSDTNRIILENRGPNGTIEFYANTSTGGTSGRVKVMEIEDTDVKIHKTLTMDGAYIFLDDDVGIRFYEDDSNGSNYGAIKFPASIANNFTLTLGGNRTLANPTNLTAGQSGVILVLQDGTGSRTLSFGSYWKFPGGTAPTLTTTASAVDLLVYFVESSSRILAILSANMS